MGEAIVRSFAAQGARVSLVNLLEDRRCRARERASRARRVQHDDIAVMVTFLASDDARMCSGWNFVGDGG